MLLAGDIGGTKTVIAVYSAEQGARLPLIEKTYSSNYYSSLEEIIISFLQEHKINSIEKVVLGVAGPVISGSAAVTNLPWVIDEQKLKNQLKIPQVKLLNDLQAIAYAVPYLDDNDLHTIKSGKKGKRGNIAVIAPGTGLGESFLVWNGSTYYAFASEGGHSDFAPNTSLEMKLLTYLQRKYEHVSYERVCSGIGLPNIYYFLLEDQLFLEPSWLAAKLKDADDPTPVIINAALDNERVCDLCKKTLKMFVSILGAEAGNLALKIVASGGVFLGGGIPPRIIRFLEDDAYINSFKHKGRMHYMMENIPLYVILNSKAALLGCAILGLKK